MTKRSRWSGVVMRCLVAASLPSYAWMEPDPAESGSRMGMTTGKECRHAYREYMKLYREYIQSDPYGKTKETETFHFPDSRLKAAEERMKASCHEVDPERKNGFDPEEAECMDGNGFDLDIDGDDRREKLLPLNQAEAFAPRIYRIGGTEDCRSTDEGIWVLNDRFDGFRWRRRMPQQVRGIGWLHCFLRRERDGKAWVRILYDEGKGDLDRAQGLVEFQHDGIRIMRWKPRLSPLYRDAYIAKISPRDLHDTHGKPLMTIGAILKRDRENFYQGRFDPEDTGMERYRDPRERAMLERLPILPGNLSMKELLERILFGGVLLEVHPTSSGIEIRVLPSTSSHQPSANPAGGQTAG